MRLAEQKDKMSKLGALLDELNLQITSEDGFVCVRDKSGSIVYKAFAILPLDMASCKDWFTWHAGQGGFAPGTRTVMP